MTRFNVATIGQPRHEIRHPRIRVAASLVAAVSGAFALLLVGFLLVGGVALSDATWAVAGIVVFGALWATGAWWRWTAPDARDPHHERERRGF